MDSVKSWESRWQYSFSLESLLRGLSDKSNDELTQRLSVVKREIRKYKHMLDVARYKAEINNLGESIY